MYDKHSKAITLVITNYFSGIYSGNIAQLEDVFHSEALLFGDIKGIPYFKTVTEYIEGVKNRKSPKDLDEEFKMEILSIELLGNNAIAKLHLPMLGYNYYDFLSLSFINQKWIIVNKLFTHVDEI